MALPAPVLLAVQLAAITAACRLAARAVRPLLQPPVVGEMIAGILLGPSLLGALAPAASAALFPAESLPLLTWAGLAGLSIHMLGSGIATRAEVAFAQARSAARISAAGLLAPFVFGAGLAFALHGRGDLFGPGVGAGTAALFLGAAMSITAFPVLARILADRGLTGTPLGAVVLSAGALDDVAAWLVVCGLVWAFKAEATLLISLSFLAGLFLSPSGTVARVRARVVGWTDALLLPVYFATSGLKTSIGLLDGSWGIFLLILLAATLGKGGACWLAASLEGRPRGEALAIGALMNARGLMELIIINIGLQRGIIGEGLFATLVIMAIVTTLMASPIFDRLVGKGFSGEPQPDEGGGDARGAAVRS